MNIRGVSKTKRHGVGRRLVMAIGVTVVAGAGCGDGSAPGAPGEVIDDPSSAAIADDARAAGAQGNGRNGRAEVTVDFEDDGATWTELGAGTPVRDRLGAVGFVLQPTFVDTGRPGLMTALVCSNGDSFPDFYDWRTCRPATSRDRARGWTVHDSPRFAFVDSLALFSPANAARSPANPRRMYFSVAGHPWESPDPRGGLWRSDDDGATWSANLFAGQAGEAGLVRGIVPDPVNADRVYITRGYDFGNVSRSDNAGRSFRILCGHSTTAKTGSDSICGGSLGTWTVDFTTAKMFYKHHFQPWGVDLNLDGSNPQAHPFVGLDIDYSGVASLSFSQTYLPVRGLPARVGGSSVAYTADGVQVVYRSQGPTPTLWRSTPDFRTGQQLTGVAVGGQGLVLTHPRVACVWVVQSDEQQLSVTRDCGATWSPVPTDGLDPAVRFVSAAWAPVAPFELIAFTRDGRRFKTRP
jgi:hypothetical protein